MAITWKTYDKVAQDSGRKLEKTETTHEGLVVKAEWKADARVMSDIYAIGTYCEVFNPTENRVEKVLLRTTFELESHYGFATVDICDGPYEAQYVAYLVEKARKDLVKRQEAARLRAEARFHTPEKGKVMQVVRGRKVAVGTIGRVFWVGSDRYSDGTRVGLALDDAKNERGGYKNTVFVDGSYLVNLDAEGPDYSGVPAA